jgi:dUTP pyrophosphatase
MQINCYIKPEYKDVVILPKKAHESDACFDLVAADVIPSMDKYLIGYDTGIVFDIPAGWCAKVYARSSVVKSGMMLANGTGIIDSGYLGTIKLFFYRIAPEVAPYRIGDRIAQIMFLPVPQVELLENDYQKLAIDTDRGTGGYGSTGR